MTDSEFIEKYSLEPETMGCSTTMCAHSIAISLKRIADMMERSQVTVSAKPYEFPEFDYDWVMT